MASADETGIGGGIAVGVMAGQRVHSCPLQPLEPQARIGGGVAGGAVTGGSGGLALGVGGDAAREGDDTGRKDGAGAGAGKEQAVLLSADPRDTALASAAAAIYGSSHIQQQGSMPLSAGARDTALASAKDARSDGDIGAALPGEAVGGYPAIACIPAAVSLRQALRHGWRVEAPCEPPRLPTSADDLTNDCQSACQMWSAPQTMGRAHH